MRGLPILSTALAALGLLIAGIVIGRSQSTRVAVAPPQARATAVHEHTGTCAHPPPEVNKQTPLTPIDHAQAATELNTLINAPDRLRRLNELQETLALQLADGTTTAVKLLELFRNETDTAVLEVLIAALLQNPSIANAPDVVAAFRESAESDRSSDRRRAAMQFLGSAWDRDGQTRATLLKLAKDEPDTSCRHTAIAALKEYSIKNHEAAHAVNSELIAIARSATQNEFRSAAIESLAMYEAQEGTLQDLLPLLEDRSNEVRLSAADALGDIPAEHRARVVPALDAAIAREPDAALRSALLWSLVRAGRTEAVPTLERIAQNDPALQHDALDYAVILKRGESDLFRIRDEKQRLEMKRPK